MEPRHASGAAVLALALFACGRLLGVSGDDDEERSSPRTSDDAGSEAATAESSGDASVSPDARFCETVDATYCEDFDRMDAGPDVLEPPWYSYANDQNGHSVVAEGRSPPHALAVEGTSADFAEGWVVAMEDGARAVSIEIAVATLGSPAPTSWLQITWNGPTSRHGFRIDLPWFGAGNISEIEGPVNSETYHSSTALNRPAWPPGWHSVVLDVDWTANVAKLLVDGISVAETAMATPFTPGPLAVEIGAHSFASAGDPKRILYDDVVVRAR